MLKQKATSDLKKTSKRQIILNRIFNIQKTHGA